MKGQALVTLLFFMIFATTVTTAAVLVIVANSISGAKFQDGTVAYEVARSGADNALLRLLRDPSYTGETLTIGSGSATITASGLGTVANPYIATSSGKVGNFIKKVEVRAHIDSNTQLIIDAEKEIF